MGNPIVRYEAGQTAYPFEALTDSGDHAVFVASFSPISNAAGSEPVVAPYGLLTGGALTPSGTNNVVNVAALTASMAAVSGASSSGVISVAGTTATITRPATAVAKVCSITVDSAGAVAVVAGSDGATTTFAPTFTAELHLGGAHPSDTEAQQIGSLYQFGGMYGLSLDLTHTWSQEGTSHTDAFTFSFDATTDATPLLDSPSAFALFAAQQAATGANGHVYLTKGTSSELGSTQDAFEFNATITNVSAVPEPASLALMLQGGLAMGGLFAARKLRAHRA